MDKERWSRIRTGIIVGAIGGYLYYHLYGCDSAACNISASPYLSPLYGMAVGSLVWDKLKPDDEER